MSRQKKTEEQRIEFNTNFWVSIVFLIIMILSIVGFAMMSSGGASSSNTGEMPENLPMQIVEYEGNTYYVSIKNSEQFVFTPDGVELFQSDLITAGIANKISAAESLKIVSLGNFTSADADYLLEKVLRANKVPFEYVQDGSCDSASTLVLTNNIVEGDCIQFISSNEEAYEKMTSVVYHLVK